MTRFCVDFFLIQSNSPTSSSSYLILFLTSNQSYANCLDGPYRQFAQVCAPRIPSKAEAWLQLPPRILVLEITKYEADVQVRFIELLASIPVPLKDTDRYVSSNLKNTSTPPASQNPFSVPA